MDTELIEEASHTNPDDLDGPIIPGDEFADLIGFKLELFHGYLFANADTVCVSAVISLEPRQGNFENFVNNLLNHGYTVLIPGPLPMMENFVKKHNFRKTFEDSREFGPVEVWKKSPK